MLAAVGLCCLAFSGPAWAADDGVTRPEGYASEANTPRVLSSASELGVANRGDSCSLFVHGEMLADGRTEAVQSFLESYKCDVTDLAHDFVLAAELNKIDYRLLPVLAVVETGCGRAARKNNLFGWANGRKPFGSFRQSIHFVAQRLRVAPHYAGKTVPEKLKVYNRRVAFQRKVLAMMQAMPEPVDDPVAEASSADVGGFE